MKWPTLPVSSQFALLGVLLLTALLPGNAASFTLNAPTTYTKGTLDVGSRYYLDDRAAIKSQPAGFETLGAVIPRNSDRDGCGADHIQLFLPTAATIYVAFDRRATTLPDWLQSFTRTGQRIYVEGTRSAQRMDYFEIYRKDYPAGTVTLGGNCYGATGARNHYLVYVEEGTALAVTPGLVNLAPGDTASALIGGGTGPYSVVPADPAIATATISGNTISINGIGNGTTTLTITDATGATTTVTVNVSTLLAVTPAIMTMPEGTSDSATVSGGTGPYSAVSSNPGVASASVAGNMVTVTGISGGTVTVTVTDTMGAVGTISVTVIAPLTVNPTSLSLNVSDAPVTVTISGGVGPYTVLSGNSGVATATVSGSTITVTPKGGGTMTIQVRDSLLNLASVLVVVGGGTFDLLGSCPSPPFTLGSGVQSNIMIMLDHSGSMGNGAGSKWDIAKSVVIDILQQFPNVRFGLMRLDATSYTGYPDIGVEAGNQIRQGGKVLKPCGTPTDEIINYISNWGDNSGNPSTYTNLAETLATAGQYFATTVENGVRVGKGPADLGYYEKNYHYPTAADDATYTDDKGNIIDTTSPIMYECQKSFVIMITDGQANYDNDWSVVTNGIGDYDNDHEANDCAYGAAGCTAPWDDGTYLDDVAQYLYEHDMRSDIPGMQNIITYTVGFQIDFPLLKQAAEQAGGQYYTATDAAQLTAALQDAIRDILDKISSGTAVSTISTSSESDDYLLRAKFLPMSWKGYLEAFTMPYSASDTPAWEAGQLLSDKAALGTLDSRNIFTSVGSAVDPKQEFTTGNVVLTNSAGDGVLDLAWSTLTAETMDIMEFIRGDVTNEGGKYRDRSGWPLGDIIYSTPVAVGPPKYYYRENGYQLFKTAHADRARMIYVGANDGMLHAFLGLDENGADCSPAGADYGSMRCAGSEQWAFIPGNLQSKLKQLTVNNCHEYFVDLTPMATDVWDSAFGAAELGWRTMLVGGNRLGGDGYFCLDVTDPAPDRFEVRWNLIPFPNFKSSTVPAFGKVKAGSVDRWVAILTSGYHEGTLSGKIAAMNYVDGAKEAVFFDGAGLVTELTTQAKSAANPYYTLSSPAALDSDGDGYLDLIYAGDTEGALWKFYYDYVDMYWKKVKLFQTPGQAITAKPSLVFDDGDRLRIYFGTGKYLVGGDKLNTTRNGFYCLVEKKQTGLGNYNDGHYTNTAPIALADLLDMTPYHTKEEFEMLFAVQQQQAFENGWYFNLDIPTGPAERIFNESLVVAGCVIATSFMPNSDVCGYGGDAWLYAVDYKRGTMCYNGEEPIVEYLEPEKKRTKLGPGTPSEPIYADDEILVQTSDTSVHVEAPNFPEEPMAIQYWRHNLF